MNKKVIAIVAAGVLALMGVAVVALWAKQADQRAFDGAELVSVVQVRSAVKQGTPASELGASVRTVKLPSSAVPKDAVRSLEQVSGRVTGVSLEAGEVLLASRMVDPDAKPEAVNGVPRGAQEMTLALDAQRIVGGQLVAGDTVGVILSYPQDSKMVENRVVVTRIDLNKVADSGAAQANVTLAVTTRQAERIANAAEFGKIWLTKQNAATTVVPGKAVDPKDVLR
ncbi:MAG: Flp pilus assembly protein CpaB [Aeromicrobium erythreum]